MTNQLPVNVLQELRRQAQVVMKPLLDQIQSLNTTVEEIDARYEMLQKNLDELSAKVEALVKGEKQWLTNNFITIWVI